MSPEIIALRDDKSGASAKILAGFGFNCYSFVAQPAGEPIETLWSAPGFETGTERPSHSGIPILFPFPGRVRRTEIAFNGQTYPVGDLDDHIGNAIHGYVLTRPWHVLEQSPSRVVGEFHAASAAPALLKKWPADFRITVSYELKGNSLASELTIANPDDKPLPYGLGTHPYFRVPLGSGGNAGDCRITVPAREYWLMKDMLPTGETHPAAGRYNLAAGQPFAETKFDDIFSGLAQSGGQTQATIADPRGRTLRMAFDAGFKACVVYNPPHREAICIEPYSCIPDPFTLTAAGVDAGLRVLEPGKSATSRIVITLE